MPNCYTCEKETPITRFYLLRIYRDEKSSIWFYACGVTCLKALVLNKTQGYDNPSFLLREYMTTCGRAWRFSSRAELKEFVEGLV